MGCIWATYSIRKMSQLNILDDIGQGQRSLHVPHLMLVIICAKYGKISRTVSAVERTQQDVSYLSSFIAKTWLNDLEDIGQGQSLLHTAHSLMLVIICAK